MKIDTVGYNWRILCKMGIYVYRFLGNIYVYVYFFCIKYFK